MKESTYSLKEEIRGKVHELVDKLAEELPAIKDTVTGAPTTKEAARKIRYGQWAGKPKGNPYQPGRCAHELFDQWIGRQCSRKNGHGPDGLYCKVHARRFEKTE